MEFHEVQSMTGEAWWPCKILLSFGISSSILVSIKKNHFLIECHASLLLFPEFKFVSSKKAINCWE